MYKLTFAILLVSAAQPTAFGETIDRLNRGLDPAAWRADGFGREWAAGVAKPSGRRPEVVTGVPSKLTVGQRSDKGPKLAGGRRPQRTNVVKARATSDAAAPGSIGKAGKTVLSVVGLPGGTRPASSAPASKTRRAGGSQTRAGVSFPSGTSLTVVRGRDRVGQEHYDPTGSGNPLLDTGGTNRFKMLSDNFTVGEIARSGGKTFDLARIDPRQVICLQAIRDYVGKPVWIRSGYRSFWHNVEVYRRMGKKPTNSQHISGKAADIRIQGMTGLEVAKAAIDACGPDLALGLGFDYAHVDVRGYPGVWGYDGVPRRQTAELERYRGARRVALRGGSHRRRRVSIFKAPETQTQTRTRALHSNL